MSVRRFTAAFASLTLSLVATAWAQDQAPVGYTPASGAAERALEADVSARPSAANASEYSRVLSHETHVSGTPAQARTRDYVIGLMKSWGLETEVRAYDVFMPHPTQVGVWRISPSPKALPLAEPPVAGDPTSALPQYLTVNGYSGQGDVTADVVYVNYGLVEDYATLDSAGISVKGKIVIARYGRSFRGIKAREAEKHGAVALLIYSDPQDDGYARGDVYPDGPMRPARGVQRGSILNDDGDPSTPGYPSTSGAKRLAESAMNIPHIPVVPIGYGNAEELLRDLRGAKLPQQGWQGALPFRYHVGPGPVKARVMVKDDRATKPYKTIWNTYGIIRGSEYPDEMVLIGGHRDAWTPGAADNVSGTVSVLEAARSIAEAAKAGHRPKRTIVFATWDAEEWGLLGSTEYVEDDSLRLKSGAVAYLNQDVAAQGPSFGGGGSPSLGVMMRDVTSHIPDPSGTGSVYAEWRTSSRTPQGSEPALGEPGGGSDFAGFYNHLGIPIAEWGFGGPGGVYHSQYDSYAWMKKFGDSSFAYHAGAARVATGMILRLANADVLPYDYAEYARALKRYLPALDKAIADRHWSGSTAAVAAALDRMEAAANAFAATRDSSLGGNGAAARYAAANQALLQVERALVRPTGLRTRPWFRNLIFAADENNGYSTMVLPSIGEAVRAGDERLTTSEVTDLASRIDAATRAIDAARMALAGR